MRITELPQAASVAQTDDLAIDVPGGRTYRVPRSILAPAPYIATIPTGQWSGSGSDRYITVTASNVTADAMLYPFYDNASAALLNGPVWVIPAAGSFTIHTSAIPSGTVTISVLLAGIVGEAQYQVLADVYSKSQVDTIVAQSTANSISYQSGDSISSGQDWIVLPGVISDDSKRVVFTLPLTKTPVTDRTYTLTYLRGRILKPDGGIYESTKNYLNYTGCTTTIVKNSGKSLFVRLVFDTALTIAAGSFVGFNGRFDITVS